MTEEEKIAQALRPFGWTCGREFFTRYYSDPWVFHLANAVLKLTEQNDRVVTENDRLLRAPAEGEPCPVCGEHY